MAKKKDSKKKPSPSLLGTGMARSAASAAIKRAKRNCTAIGGTYDPKTGKCKS